jgi:hypothetical protein
MAVDDHLKKVVDRSGFPLQLGIAGLVGRTTGDHGYTVIYQEHAWRRSDAESGYLDLVLQDRHESLVLAIECKRVLDTDWIFLQSGPSIAEARTARGWVTYSPGNPNGFIGWWDFDMAARAPQAQFCVVPKDDKAVPMLERIASELVSATEALALEDYELRPLSGEAIRMHFSVIVTSARLRVTSVDPEKINLADGTTSDLLFQEVPVVMFRKQLAIKPVHQVDRAMQTKDVAAAKEHTVFVVNSEAVHDFLVNFDVMPDSIRLLKFNRN